MSFFRCPCVAMTLFAALLVGVFVNPARATITLNLSTGLNASGVVQTTSGASDANWVTNSQPAGVVTSASADWWGFWPADDTHSSWIALNPSSVSQPTGSYTRTFDLTGISLSSVSMAGNWCVDDEGTLSLNGHQIGAYQGHDGWQNFLMQTFSVDNSLGWFNQGVNTLTLNIAATDDFFEGVRLNGSLTGSSPAPEPASLAILGFGAVALLRKRGARVERR